ncbi:hypothetical protein [Phytomonospora endophytica]|uniref:Uncharacterized protein n=1 Tax=Phytomonospora endophytica TaxID=714109 RepID=A0A841FVR7_9ACTN|nr:hypothetical protein [Phytomonospora endophytica]MBB6037632.1 hypothetical protein [Phytomonospora endophytica]GIG67841.1 hypothetical protein Pen01_41360 [Phytomonospora endophytica]
MRIEFQPAARGGTRTVLHRADGVVLEMGSHDRKWRVPHDLAHAVTERELSLHSGLFGCVAAGAVFDTMSVVSGSPRHDAAARSERILKAHGHALSVAEALAGVVHEFAESGDPADPTAAAREAWGVVEQERFPYEDGGVGRAVETLRELAADWALLLPGRSIELNWPAGLVAEVPAAPQHREARSSRRDRGRRR